MALKITGNTKNLFLLFTLLTLGACSSTPLADAPPWVKGAARVVENGYIIYVGTGEDPTTERAQFLAESMALQDLANECSFVPKGARVEDRYSEKQKYTYMAFAKVAVEFQECDGAKKASDPSQIQQLANVGFTEEIKKYQDIVEGVSPESDGTNLIAPDGTTTAQNSGGVAGNGGVHFFVMRQYVAYQNQVVILSPPNSYPPGAPQTVAYTNSVAPVTKQVQMYEMAHPELKNSPQTWSHTPNKPQLFKNQPPRGSSGNGVKVPPRPGNYRGGQNRGGQRPPPGPNGYRGRRRRGGYNDNP